MSFEPSPLLTAEQLTCIREDRILFEQLSFAINAGEIVQIEGPNGAGKTSLLRILAGLASPFDGTVYFDNQDIIRERELYAQHLLFLGHKAGVKSELTAQENLEFSLNLHQQESMNAEALLEEVGLLAFEDSPAAQLSAGQHRRIALAQLWQSNAKVWILDEPFTAIDIKGVAAIEHQILKHADNGGCVILTTHQALSIPNERITTLNLDYRF